MKDLISRMYFDPDPKDSEVGHVVCYVERDGIYYPTKHFKENDENL